MPFKSQAQRRKFAQLLVEGKISPATKRLPEHVARKRKSAKKSTTKRARSRKR